MKKNEKEEHSNINTLKTKIPTNIQMSQNKEIKKKRKEDNSKQKTEVECLHKEIINRRKNIKCDCDIKESKKVVKDVKKPSEAKKTSKRKSRQNSNKRTRNPPNVENEQPVQEPRTYTSYFYTISLTNSRNFIFTVEVPSSPGDERMQSLLNTIILSPRPSRSFLSFLTVFFSNKEVLDKKELDKIKIEKWNGTPEDCVICLQNYKDGDDIRILECKHIFHPGCVDNWLLNFSNRCPVCRECIKQK